MEVKKLLREHDRKIYLIIIGILSLTLLFFKPILGLIAIGILAILIYSYIRRIGQKEEEWIEYIENLSSKFDSTTKHAVFNMPFPLVMLDKEGCMTWYNTDFKKMIDDPRTLLNNNISKFIEDIDMEEILERDEDDPLEIKYKDDYYEVYFNIIEDEKVVSKSEKIIVLYWIKDTKYMETLIKCRNKELVPCLAYVDNYDEVKNTTPEVNRPQVLAEIDSVINNYVAQHNGIVRKYENDRYFIIFERQDIEAIKDKKFDILDSIREIDLGNTIPVTLSIGVGIGGDTPEISYEYSRGAIDITLGRGGDQAVVKNRDNISFYGGKTKAIEKRNKVKSRVMSHALRELIDQSEQVFIMGHKGADMDSFGASIGILRAVLNREKPGYIVLNEINPAIENIYSRMLEEVPEYEEHILTEDEALRSIERKDLLVVVDNHKPSFTEASSLLEETERVVLIDHHRRGAEFIEDPILLYLEPYASSTCELVTEILFYMEDKLNMLKFDADALLSGITVDTKNFTFQTGVRTFEAASILKRAGADTTKVSELFRDDYDTFLNKAQVISKSKIYHDQIAISRLEKNIEESVLIAAQGANSLLNIDGIEASFVLTQLDDQIHISGRSLGKLSVQIILEKLGGGGHLTSAGTQINNVSIDKAEEMLLGAIEEYLMEGDDE